MKPRQKKKRKKLTGQVYHGLHLDFHGILSYLKYEINDRKWSMRRSRYTDEVNLQPNSDQRSND